MTGALHGVGVLLAAAAVAACRPAVVEPAPAARPIALASTAAMPASAAPQTPSSAEPTPDTTQTSAPECPSHVEQLAAGDHVGDRRLLGPRVLVVEKAARRLMLYRRGELVACERVALGFAPEGHKRRQGDGRTPEGWYRTSDKPWSRFRNAIAIHYPNAADARAGLAAGTITRRQHEAIVTADRAGKLPPQATGLGGAVLIHGGGIEQRLDTRLCRARRR